MTQKDIITALGMDKVGITIKSQIELANQYKGLYWFVKDINKNFKGNYTFTTLVNRQVWKCSCYYLLTVKYGACNVAKFELPCHYGTGDHLNAFNAAVIALLQAGAAPPKPKPAYSQFVIGSKSHTSKLRSQTSVGELKIEPSKLGTPTEPIALKIEEDTRTPVKPVCIV